MAHKLFVLLLFIIVMIKSSQGYESSKPTPGGTYDELPCLKIGGICVISTDCPQENRASMYGLCPLQQKKGIECCHALPSSETRCQKRGGECIEKKQKCPPNLTFSRATDCGADEKCCILVN